MDRQSHVQQQLEVCIPAVVLSLTVSGCTPCSGSSCVLRVPAEVFSAVGVGSHMRLHVRLLQEHTAVAAAVAAGRRPALFSADPASTDCSVKL